MLKLADLRNQESWVGRTPEEIRKAVIAHGGWAVVFPRQGRFPIWASRVRNYFNARPTRLKRLGLAEARKAKAADRMTASDLYDVSLTAFLSLTGTVYRDDEARNWYEMVPVGTIYHFKDKGWDNTTYKKVKYLAEYQKDTPVFKLVSPDGTGGSKEVCIHNWQHGSSKGKIGPVGQWVNVDTKTVINEIYRGSYNYSETCVVGLPDHEFRDVDPHITKYGFYKNPTRYEDRRRFKASDFDGKFASAA
ncbi:MAG: hypothetical protein AAF074_20365 [Pseudomonadota bacterium]